MSGNHTRKVPIDTGTAELKVLRVPLIIFPSPVNHPLPTPRVIFPSTVNRQLSTFLSPLPIKLSPYIIVRRCYTVFFGFSLFGPRGPDKKILPGINQLKR